MVHVEHLIIGTGFSGIAMGAQLKKAGLNNFVILEKGDGIGGAWRENDYPGCTCDVQSHLYSYSYAPNPDWSRTYAPQDEIRSYIENTARSLGIMTNIHFNHGVKEAIYCEDTATWKVTCLNGEEFSTKILISGIGGLHIPKIPDIPGMKSFKGKVFHSAQWDHDYDFKDKNVAVIGTGASAIQFVPQLTKVANHLTLFQRSAPWVLPKPNRKITSLEKSIFTHLPLMQKLFRAFYYLQLESRTLVFIYQPKLLGIFEKYFIRHLNKQVKNEELREKLTPNSKLGCKRVLLSNDYYPALDQDNADVVTCGIKSIKKDSIIDKDGAEHKIDAVVYGTGFKAGETFSAINIRGKGGISLNDTWENGSKTFAGVNVAGFPNLFMMMGPNTGLSHNSFVYIIESQAHYIKEAVVKARNLNWKSVDVKADKQDEFVDKVQSQSTKSVWLTGCQSWYLDDEGRNWTLWPSFTFKYRWDTRRFDTSNYAITYEDN